MLTFMLLFFYSSKFSVDIIIITSSGFTVKTQNKLDMMHVTHSSIYVQNAVRY